MSWLSSAFHHASHVVSTVARTTAKIAGSVAKVAGPALAVASIFQPELAPIAAGTNVLGGGSLFSKLLPAASKVSSAVNAVSGKASSPFGNILSDIGNVLNPIISKIKTPISDIVNIADELQNKLINPIVKPAINTYEEITTLTKAIESSLHKGIQGYLQIPGEIANALGSTMAQWQRSTEQSIQAQKEIAEKIITPAYPTAAKDGLDQLHDFFTSYYPEKTEEITQWGEQGLKEIPDYSEILSKGMASLKQIRDTKGLWGDFARLIVAAVNYLPAAYEIMQPGIIDLKQEVASKSPVTLLPVASAIEAHYRGEITDEELSYELSRMGYDESRINILKKIALQLIPVQSLIQARRRGIISEEDYKSEMSNLNWDESRSAVLFELTEYLPTPQDAMRYYARSKMPESGLDEILKSHGFSDTYIEYFKQSAYQPTSPREYASNYSRMKAREKGFLSKSYEQTPDPRVYDRYDRALLKSEQADLDWLAHWRDMPEQLWLQAYWRGYVTQEDVKIALQQMNYPDELIDIFVKSSRPLIQLWMIPDILATGVMNEEQARAYLARMGFDQIEIDIMIEYGKARGMGKLASSTEALHQLSLSNLKQMFDIGLIDQNQYIQGLEDHGYSAESATLLAELETMKNTLKEREQTADDIVNEVESGLIDSDTGISKLYELGFSTGEVSKYLAKLKRVRTAKAKIPSEEDLKKMYQKHIIDRDTWEKAMKLLGYSKTWIDRLFEVNFVSG